MRKLWQRKQKLSYSKNVFEIVQFGSSVLERSNPADLDIAVIFTSLPVKEQLKEGQKIKKQIEKLSDVKVQIENFSLDTLFKPDNFAREGILFYGKSLLTGKNFAERFGLIPILRISYTLKDLEKKDKIKFNYLLNGKGGNYGLLRKYGGKIVSPGVLETLPENEIIFKEEMKKITPRIKIEKIYFSKQ